VARLPAVPLLPRPLHDGRRQARMPPPESLPEHPATTIRQSSDRSPESSESPTARMNDTEHQPDHPGPEWVLTVHGAVSSYLHPILGLSVVGHCGRSIVYGSSANTTIREVHLSGEPKEVCRQISAAALAWERQMAEVREEAAHKLNTIRALVGRWKASASFPAATQGEQGFCNGLNSCAAELRAALDEPLAGEVV